MSENYNFNSTNNSSNSPVDSIPSFSSFKNKDGSFSHSDDYSSKKKKNVIADIIDKPITITAVNFKQSRYDDNKQYMVLEYTDENGEECYTTTSSTGIRNAIENKGDNISFPCKATVVQRASKMHPGYKYLTLK